MSRVQPQTLTNEEFLRHIYMHGFDDLPADWVRQFCERFVDLLDEVENLKKALEE